MRIPTGPLVNPILTLWEETFLSDEEKAKRLGITESSEENVKDIYTEIETKPVDEIQKAKDDIVGKTFKEVEANLSTPQIFKTKKSLTDLSNDDVFNERAERFLEGIGSNDNIFEYLRDEQYSLSSAIVRSFQVGKWTEEQKKDYTYLRDEFMNTDLKGFKEHFGLVKDLAGDLLLDPLNIMAAIFAIPTGGSTLAGRAALVKPIQQSLQAFTKSKLKKSIIKGTAKDFALYGAAEGMAWGGLQNYFMQDINVDLDLIENIDLNQTAVSGLVGSLMGGTLGAGLGAGMGIRYSKFAEKEFRYVNEDATSFVGPNQRKVELDNWEIDQATRDVEDINFQDEDLFFNYNPDVNYERTLTQRVKETIKNKLPSGGRAQHSLNFWMARTTGKPTTEFLEDAKKSELLQNFLRKMRYDYDTGLVREGERGVKTAKLKTGEETPWSFGEYVGRQFGKYHSRLNQGLNKINRTGFWSKLAKDESDTLFTLLSSKRIGIKKGEGKIDIDTLLQKGEYVSPTTNKKYLVNEDMAFAYKSIRGLLDDSFDEAQSIGLFKPNTINEGGFFPRLFKFDVLYKKQDVFVEKLIKSGHADTINTKTKFQVKLEDGTEVPANRVDDLGLDAEVFNLKDKYNVESFEQLAKKMLQADGKKNITEFEITTAARKLKGEEIVQGMIDAKYTPYELRKAGANNSMGFFQSRKFSKLKDEDIAEFLETDVQQVLENYFTNMAQSQGRKKYFGNTIREFQTEKFAIVQELQKNGMNREEAEKIGDGIQTMFKRVTGLETYSNSILKNNKYGRVIGDVLKLSQQAAHLPFATLSSITEPLILLSRANVGDGKNVAGDLGKAIVAESKNSWSRFYDAMSRAQIGGKYGTPVFKTSKKVKGFKDVDDETWTEIYHTGLALEQAVQDRIEGLTGEALTGSRVKRLQQTFFKTNLLTQWTKAVQLASFQTGKRLIKTNTEQLYNNKTLLGRELTENNRKYLTKQLNELGVNENDALKWYKSSLDKHGKYDANKGLGLNKKGELIKDKYGNMSFNGNFYNNQYLSGANRFTKEIILNPSTAEANRPLWFSRPDAQLLVQFMGYPTVFNNTILKRFSNEMKNNTGQAAPKILSTALLMTTVAHLGNEIRSNGKATIDYKTGETKPTYEIIGEAARRWGLFGPVDYGYRFNSEIDRNAGTIAAGLKSVGGPLIQDAADSLLYRKGITEVLATNIPYYSAFDLIFGEGTKESIRRAASGKLKKKEKKAKPIKYFSKGGIVKNVPNVTDEPDEMQSRVTGQPFNATSEAAQDIEDRELKSQMEGLGIK